MTGDLIIALTPIGTIVGREKEGKSGFYLKDPRLAFPVQNEAGQTVIGLQRLPGDPDLLFIPSSTPFYDNKDGALEEAYTRSTTSLVLSQVGTN